MGFQINTTDYDITLSAIEEFLETIGVIGSDRDVSRPA